MTTEETIIPNKMLPVILLVDDDEDTLALLETILLDKYTVLKSLTSEDALKVLEAKPVQLVVSDVMMPGLNGFELCKLIKSTFKYSHIPVILLTANIEIRGKVEGLESGAEAYMEKPVSKEHLQAQIFSLLSNRIIIRKYFADSPLVHIKNVAYSKADERFLETLNDTIIAHIEEIDLDVEKLARFMNMSRITLYRKMKTVSALTPIEIINKTRLKKAAELLALGDHKIYEISYMVGFSSQSNFARDFQRQFNITPTKYMHLKQLDKRKSTLG